MAKYAYLLPRPLRALASGRTPNEPADARLLERFTRHHDEGAFAALVERHGPMVIGHTPYPYKGHSYRIQKENGERVRK